MMGTLGGCTAVIRGTELFCHRLVEGEVRGGVATVTVWLTDHSQRKLLMRENQRKINALVHLLEFKHIQCLTNFLDHHPMQGFCHLEYCFFMFL